MKTFEIIPNNGRKSFYGKAIACEYNGNTVLKSYNTDVARIDAQGHFTRLWSGYSLTTMAHINAFRAMYGMARISKSEWNEMKIDTYNPLVNAIIEYKRIYG